MAVGDEPDFGFLNDDSSAAEPAEQFSFGQLDSNLTPATPAAAETDERSPKPSKAQIQEPRSTSDDSITKKQKVKRPVKAVPDLSTQAVVEAQQPTAGQTKAKRRTKNPPDPANQPNVADTAAPESLSEDNATQAATVPKSQFLALAVSAAVLAITLLLQMLGIINLSGSHQLESVPDMAPLKAGEFQHIPETALLPTGHELRLGQEARFGDIIFTPTKVVREPLSFVHMTTRKSVDDMTSSDVLKLYFTVKNVSAQVAFPPWDVSLMTYRSPTEGVAPSTKANSWLQVSAGNKRQRVLNYLHSPKSNFDIVDMSSRIALQPDESRSMFIASSEGVDDWLLSEASLKWRVQIRKGVHLPSKRSVTTLVDIAFTQTDIQL